MKLISACLILLSVYCSSVFAGEVRQIELNDGSVISGQILSFIEGVYTINSSSLGTLQIADANIRAIRSASSRPTTGVTVNPSLILPGTDLQALQELMANPEVANITGAEVNPSLLSAPNIQGLLGSMMGNPEVMSDILSLQNDPDFLAVLQDPETMRALMSGDINALINNPTFLKLLEHQQVKKIAHDLEVQK